MIIRKANYDDVKILNRFLTLLIRDERQYDLGLDENLQLLICMKIILKTPINC